MGILAKEPAPSVIHLLQRLDTLVAAVASVIVAEQHKFHLKVETKVSQPYDQIPRAPFVTR